MFSKKSILTYTFNIGICTMLSRLFGIIRESLTVYYLGAGMLNDAFVTAFKIPNGLRKIFAEGAMSAALIPSLSTCLAKKNNAAANGIMTLSFLVFEGFVLLLCICAILYAPTLIHFIAPGFSPEAIQIAVHCLRIVMPFILFISSSALCASSLQSVGHFLVPAVAPVVLNIVFIITLLLCIYFHLPVTYLCWGILAAGAIQFIMHLIWYIHLNFGFGAISKEDIAQFRAVLVRFLLCLPSVSLMELSLFVDTSFASYLKPGTITLINLANRFVGIPLGVFALAFATVLLPHFSHVMHRAPRRLSFYMLEGAKLVFFVSLPVMLLMWYFAEPIFETLFLSGDRFTYAHVHEAARILQTFLLGLFFFSFNKIILNVYYAMHVAWVPALISTIAAAANILLDWLFLDHLQSVGLALATTISGSVRTILLLVILHYYYKQRIYVGRMGSFAVIYTIQALLFFIPFMFIYKQVYRMLSAHDTNTIVWFMIHNIGFWFWVGPLCIVYCLSLWYCQKNYFRHMYFI